MKKIVMTLFVAGVLFAQAAQLPSELKSWESTSFVSSASNPNELSKATLKVGTTSLVGLINTPKIEYKIRPTNEGGTVSYGGLFQVEIKEAGNYRVALANGSWIDLVKDDKSAKSIKHGHGPENSGIRKMVDYTLEAGVYTLQLSAGGDSVSAVLVTKLD